jgi:CheY-like chemotaxis protein
MPQVLIVEDDPFKHSELAKALEGYCKAADIHTASSVREAIAAIESQEFNCILLDVALPSHDLKKGLGAPTSLPSGGIEVLMELSYLRRRDQVVIVTQYPEVELEGRLYTLSRVQKKIREIMQVELVGVVQFDRLSDAWRSQLTSICRRML